VPNDATLAADNMARQAHELVRDLTRANPWIYWLDLTATALVLYASLWLATTSEHTLVAAVAAVVCTLALYRAISFIHELTHLRPDEAPGFHLAWNLAVGVPFLTPSLMYEGVHILHHARDRYGTARDPEYHPLARLPPIQLAVFLAIALLAPVGVALRFAVMAPLGLLIPPLRRLVTARMSAMTINPAFAREDFDRSKSAAWLAQEIGCWIWSWTLIALTAIGVIPLRAMLIAISIYAAMAFLNQLRTAVAHAWENDGEPMSVQAQYLDTVNVPPPATLPMLWAPVGLRYHALHHLAPRLPYHNLGIAHRRLVAAFPTDSDYHRANRAELIPALAHLLRRMRARP
jgi:fatty acid desaturase